MPKDVWTLAYTRGYYYGRSGREDIAEVDSCYIGHAGFDEGIRDGKEDFANIDVTEQALEATHEAAH